MTTKNRIPLNPDVEDSEPLARFIFSRNHFSKTEKRIRRQAFLPHKNKISVIRHRDCPKQCLLKIGQNLEKLRGINMKAVCSVLTEDVRKVNNLNVVSDTSCGQHRRHANIQNFSNYNEAKIKQLAQKIADKAELLDIV